MNRRTRAVCWWAVAGLGLHAGCGSLPGRATPPHPPASLFDTGPTPKVTKRGAADIQLALGRTHEEAERLDEAAAAYKSALGKDPKRADIEDRLAVVLDRKGDAAGADEHFARASKLDPGNADYLVDRGYGLYLRGKQPEAERALRAALALDPRHARGHTNLGLVLAARGDSDAAVAEFGRAGTDPADARSNLALALALGGKVEAARDEYARALAAKPTSKPASEGLRVASTALKAGATPKAKAAPAGLPPLPGEQPATAVAAASRVDPAVVATSFAR